MKATRGQRVADLTLVLSVFASVLLVWEGAVIVFQIPEFVLPSIPAVAEDFLSDPLLFGEHAAFTVGMAVGGFLCASVIGVILAILILSSRILDRILMTFLALMHSVPKVALAPIFVIWLGAGFEPKIAIAALMSLLVIAVECVAGFRSVDPEVIQLARVNHASTWAIMRKIRVPHALPYLFSAWKVAISLSLIGAIVGEYVGGQRGLGYLILIAQGSFDTPRAFAAVLVLSAIATALFYAIVALEALCLPWHVSQRTRR